MAQAQPLHLLDLDPRDPDFVRKALVQSFRARCEMHELVLMTKDTIATTRALLVEADRMLAHM